MTALRVTLAILATAPFVLLGLAKVTGASGMPERAEHPGFGAAAYRRIGLLDLLGAAGLLVGLAVPALGLAAAACLLVLLACAAVLHLRNGDHAHAIVPAVGSAALVVGYALVWLVA